MRQRASELVIRNLRVEPMLPDELLTRAARLSSATLHEAAGRSGALPSHIKPLAPHVLVCGRALPVRSPSGDNLWLHRAIYAADPGDVLVVDVGSGIEYGYWGEVMTVAAQVRGISGLVISGGVRDGMRMVSLGFPVFAAGIAIRGTHKDPHGDGQVGEPITLGSVTINRGDLIFGDADGVFSAPSRQAEAVIARSENRNAEEQAIFRRLRAGESTLEIYNLPR